MKRYTPFSIIEVTHNNRRYIIDLLNAFEMLKLNGKVIDAKIEGSKDIVSNIEFLKLKDLANILFVKSLSIAEKNMLEDDERNIIYNRTKHYFELIEFTILKIATNYSFQFHLLCVESHDYILYPYDDRGYFFINFIVNDLGDILSEESL